jgi:large subunit ribosomal protein L2
MPLRSFKPVTPSNRYKMWPTYEEITKKKPEKGLTEPLPKSGGRNNQGRITCRHIGGGHKRKYRLIDFKRRKREVEARVMAVEYDPNRTCRIALIDYSDGEKAYILCPVGLQVGATCWQGIMLRLLPATQCLSRAFRLERPFITLNCVREEEGR